jgi:hypothetical protein
LKLRSLALLLGLSIGQLAQAADPSGTRDGTSDSPAAGASDRELARQLFSAAVSLVKAGRYAAAKSLFLEAYAAAPHYLVRYNIAQAELRLGERAAAARDLRLFLAEGGDEIDAARRAATEAEIERIEGELARETVAANGPSAVSSPASLATASATVMGSLEDLPPTPPPTPDKFAAPVQLPPKEAGAAPSKPAWAYVAITGGLALLGGGVALYVWNEGRYDDWHKENNTLSKLKQSDLDNGTAPADDALVRDRAQRNDARLASVKHFDPVPIVFGAIGLAAMGLGVWALLDSPEDDGWQIYGSLSQPELGARLRW